MSTSRAKQLSVDSETGMPESVVYAVTYAGRWRWGYLFKRLANARAKAMKAPSATIYKGTITWEVVE